MRLNTPLTLCTYSENDCMTDSMDGNNDPEIFLQFLFITMQNSETFLYWRKLSSEDFSLQTEDTLYSTLYNWGKNIFCLVQFICSSYGLGVFYPQGGWPLVLTHKCIWLWGRSPLAGFSPLCKKLPVLCCFALFLLS